jgi:hypothetical protein
MEKEMITPQQAYEAAKVLWPETSSLQKHALGWYAMQIHADGRYSAITYGSGVAIDWGDTDQYPPPEPEWVDAVFPDDVGKQGRFRNDSDESWVHGQIRGQWEGAKWIARCHVWRFCQVRKVKT